MGAKDARQREKVERLMILAFLIVFLVVVVNFVRRMGGTGSPATQGKPAAMAQAKPQGAPLSRALESEAPPAPASMGKAAEQAKASAVAYAASTLRDPLQSLLPREEPTEQANASGALMPGLAGPEKPAERSALAVQGIWWGPGLASAIINGEVYRVGDTIEGGTVHAIGPGGVTVEFGGETVELTMDRGEAGKVGGQSTSHMTAEWRR